MNPGEIELAIGNKSTFYAFNGDINRSIRYIYACDYFDLQNFTHPVLEKYSDRFYYIKSLHLNGAYIEDGDTSTLVLSPRSPNILNNPDKFNQSTGSVIVNEIKDVGEKYKLSRLLDFDTETFNAICCAFTWSMSAYHKLEFLEVSAIQSQNSFNHLLNNHGKLLAGEPLPATKHLEFFSWIYYVELKVIAEIFGVGAKIKLHDVAANTANLPLLINHLKHTPIFGVNYETIECSDLCVDFTQNSVTDIISGNPGVINSIKIFKMDLTQDNPELESADVIIANDILEHFESDQSFQVLKNLWRRTKNVLLIHVPIEKTPTKAYGHFTTFDKYKLSHWASVLPNCENLTSKYKYVAASSFDPNFIDGFLFLRRNYQ